MLSATTRRCDRCMTFLPDGQASGTCERCGRSIVPRPDRWPPDFWQFVLERRAAKATEAITGATPAQLREHLVVMTFRGTTVSGVALPWAASLEDVWPLALREYERWQTQRAASDTQTPAHAGKET